MSSLRRIHPSRADAVRSEHNRVLLEKCVLPNETSMTVAPVTSGNENTPLKPYCTLNNLRVFSEEASPISEHRRRSPGPATGRQLEGARPCHPQWRPPSNRRGIILDIQPPANLRGPCSRCRLAVLHGWPETRCPSSDVLVRSDPFSSPSAAGRSGRQTPFTTF